MTSVNVLDKPAGPGKKSLKFWLIFVALSVTLFLSALDYTAVASAMPIIVHDVDGAEFSWIGTAYALTATAFLPMTGGLAQILGRRASFVVALAFFAVGSGLCGAAKNMNWLISARAIQGVGGGAIISLASIVISDLVSLQERGTYNGMLGLTWALAVALGPVIGGAFAENGVWRWLFYMNLPVCGVSFIMVMLFMDLPTPKGTFKEKFFTMDWIGNILVAGSSASLVIALTWGGGKYQWSEVHVLVPLIVGIVGLILWMVYETKYAEHPMVDPRLIGNRTSVSGYLQVFLNSLSVTVWVYYMPVYFQACKDASALQSGIDMFGGTLTIGPFVVFGGVSVTIYKIYRPQMWFAWVVTTVGLGVLGSVKATSPLSHAIGLSAFPAIGGGIIFATTYFPVLSPLPVSLNAQALALFAFARSMAQIWGITFGSAIITNELGRTLPAQFVDVAVGGIERVYAFIPEIPAMAQPLKSEVQYAFGESLRPVWYLTTGISGLGLLVSLLMKAVPLHDYTDEQWDMGGPGGSLAPGGEAKLKSENASTQDLCLKEKEKETGRSEVVEVTNPRASDSGSGQV